MHVAAALEALGEGQVGTHGWAYRRRQPEGTVLYEAVRDNLATLLAEASEVGRGLPRYVERDFARYLECGVLAHGFARVRCESCKDELLVAFLLWRVLQRRRSGRFWLTRKQLVWQPQGGEPIHIPIHAIRPGGVRLLSSTSVEVGLVDGRDLSLSSIEDAERLVTLLEHNRQASSAGEE